MSLHEQDYKPEAFAAAPLERGTTPVADGRFPGHTGPFGRWIADQRRLPMGVFLVDSGSPKDGPKGLSLHTSLDLTATALGVDHGIPPIRPNASKAYQAAERILVEEALVMPLTYGREHMLMKPWVKQYPTTPLGWRLWKDVVIEPHP